MVTTSDREEIFRVEPAAGPHARSVGRPGILVFSRGLQLLYVNRRALELLGLSSETGTTGPVRVDLWPSVIIDLCTAPIRSPRGPARHGERGHVRFAQGGGQPGAPLAASRCGIAESGCERPITHYRVSGRCALSAGRWAGTRVRSPRILLGS